MLGECMADFGDSDLVRGLHCSCDCGCLLYVD